MYINSIFWAVAQGDIEAIRGFLSGRCIDIQDREGNTMLHLALSNRYVDLIHFLLKKNACIEIQNNNGDFPLHYGAMFFDDSILDMLISPITINAFNRIHETPIHLAAKYKNNNGVIFLLSKGADINALRIKTDLPAELATGTPLHYAVKNRDIDMALLLLKNGANPNLYNNHGLQPYYYAGWNKDQEMMNLLLNFGSKSYPL